MRRQLSNEEEKKINIITACGFYRRCMSAGGNCKADKASSIELKFDRNKEKLEIYLLVP